MEINHLAGQPAQPEMLVNVPKLITAYYTETPDPSVRDRELKEML